MTSSSSTITPSSHLKDHCLIYQGLHPSIETSLKTVRFVINHYFNHAPNFSFTTAITPRSTSAEFYVPVPVTAAKVQQLELFVQEKYEGEPALTPRLIARHINDAAVDIQSYQIAITPFIRPKKDSIEICYSTTVLFENGEPTLDLFFNCQPISDLPNDPILLPEMPVLDLFPEESEASRSDPDPREGDHLIGETLNNTQIKRKSAAKPLLPSSHLVRTSRTAPYPTLSLPHSKLIPDAVHNPLSIETTLSAGISSKSNPVLSFQARHAINQTPKKEGHEQKIAPANSWNTGHTSFTPNLDSFYPFIPQHRSTSSQHLKLTSGDDSDLSYHAFNWTEFGQHALDEANSNHLCLIGALFALPNDPPNPPDKV